MMKTQKRQRKLVFQLLYVFINIYCTFKVVSFQKSGLAFQLVDFKQCQQIMFGSRLRVLKFLGRFVMDLFADRYRKLMSGPFFVTSTLKRRRYEPFSVTGKLKHFQACGMRLKTCQDINEQLTVKQSEITAGKDVTSTCGKRHERN